jgi:hypothetical protein
MEPSRAEPEIDGKVVFDGAACLTPRDAEVSASAATAAPASPARVRVSRIPILLRRGIALRTGVFPVGMRLSVRRT